MQAINPEHLKQLRHIFDRFDTNSDGSITQLELAALLRSLGIKHTGDELYALLPNLDSNGNGFIEFDELAVALLPDLKKYDVLVNQDQLLEVFRCFDRDDNGFITAAELAGSMAKMGHPLSYKELGVMMREADVNGDGVISFNEFASVMGRSAVELFGLNNANTNTNNINNNDPS